MNTPNPHEKIILRNLRMAEKLEEEANSAASRAERVRLRALSEEHLDRAVRFEGALKLRRYDVERRRERARIAKHEEQMERDWRASRPRNG